MIRTLKFILCILAILVVPALAQRSSPQSNRIVIAASVVLDGKGRVLRDTRIVIEASKIVAIDPKAGPVSYDLRGLTVLPWCAKNSLATASSSKRVDPGFTMLSTERDSISSFSTSRFKSHPGTIRIVRRQAPS
jgi:hypothetical protein